MSSVDTLRNAIERAQVKLRDRTFELIIQKTVTDLGCRDFDAISNNLNVDFLIEKVNAVTLITNMKEEFLVESIVSNITRFLEELIKGHGNELSFHLNNIMDCESENREVSNIDKDMVEKYTEVGYRSWAEEELNAWKIIVLENFTYSQRQKWLYEKIKNGTL